LSVSSRNAGRSAGVEDNLASHVFSVDFSRLRVSISSAIWRSIASSMRPAAARTSWHGLPPPSRTPRNAEISRSEKPNR